MERVKVRRKTSAAARLAKQDGRDARQMNGGSYVHIQRILDAEPLRAPEVFEHATLSPTINFHSNAAAQSAAHERRRAATTAPLASSAVPEGGCASFWVGLERGHFHVLART